MSTPADDAADAPSSDAAGDRADSRADLLPEERDLPVQDAGGLAASVLAESDARTDDPDAGLSGTASSGVTGDDPLVSDTD